MPDPLQQLKGHSTVEAEAQEPTQRDTDRQTDTDRHRQGGVGSTPELAGQSGQQFGSRIYIRRQTHPGYVKVDGYTSTTISS